MEWTSIEALGKEEEEEKLREGLDACCYCNNGEWNKLEDFAGAH